MQAIEKCRISFWFHWFLLKRLAFLCSKVVAERSINILIQKTVLVAYQLSHSVEICKMGEE